MTGLAAERPPTPPSDELLARVSTYAVGAETIKENEHRTDVVDRFTELGAAAAQAAPQGGAMTRQR